MLLGPGIELRFWRVVVRLSNHSTAAAVAAIKLRFILFHFIICSENSFVHVDFLLLLLWFYYFFKNSSDTVNTEKEWKINLNRFHCWAADLMRLENITFQLPLCAFDCQLAVFSVSSDFCEIHSFMQCLPLLSIAWRPYFVLSLTFSCIVLFNSILIELPAFLAHQFPLRCQYVSSQKYKCAWTYIHTHIK